MPLQIRDATPQDERRWRELWAGYNRFYEATVPPEITDRTWQRLLDPNVAMFARLAEWEGEVAGFTVNVLHEGSWVSAPVCYLEDLFVDPDQRGHGIGGALIADLVALGKTQGWSGLYWHTKTDNPARKLYDRFIPADEFVRYRMRF